MLFKPFRLAVAKQFQRMQDTGALFVTKISGYVLQARYQEHFPEGTNPVFRERREHDCTCCNQFIRHVGNVVALVDGKWESIWSNIKDVDPAYMVVAQKMEADVLGAEVENIFLSEFKQAGTDFNFDRVIADQKWEHFHVNINPAFSRLAEDIGPLLGAARASYDSYGLALKEISDTAIEITLELINENQLYRGSEFKFQIETFQKLKKESATTDIWGQIKGTPESVLRIRTTAIGKFMTAISEPMYDLQAEVDNFGKMMDPANYRRTSAVVTESMVKKAKDTVNNLGMASALERRYAVLSDISVNDILFADKSAKVVMLDNDPFANLADAQKNQTPSLDHVQDVQMEDFIKNILPTASKIELLLENKLEGNLVSLTAPVDPTAPNLFNWDNGFAWSYKGDVTDAVKQRVKAAGGNIDAEFCCRLVWDSPDDLDLHMMEPRRGHIYFGSCGNVSAAGGQLDVDANSGSAQPNPCENIFYKNTRNMINGTYVLTINNYRVRSEPGEKKGFTVQIEIGGVNFNINYTKSLRQSETVEVAKFEVKDGVVKIVSSLPAVEVQRTFWGKKTMEYHPVSMVCLSPNHWDGSKNVGNKHYMFMLDGMMSDERARGFYNEYLNSSLRIHRKVFELLGSKLKVEPSDNQLSGLGFSSTLQAAVILKVTGATTRVLRVVI